MIVFMIIRVINEVHCTLSIISSLWIYGESLVSNHRLRHQIVCLGLCSTCCLDLDSTLWWVICWAPFTCRAHCTAVRVVQYSNPRPCVVLLVVVIPHPLFYFKLSDRGPLPLEWTPLSLCGLGLCSHTRISHASLCNTKPPDAAWLYTESLRRMLFKVCFSYREVDMFVRAGVEGQFILCSEQFIPFCSLCIYTEIVCIRLN